MCSLLSDIEYSAGPIWSGAQYRAVNLGASWVGEVERLERDCFAMAWPKDLIASELERENVIAMGLVGPQGELIAYSINLLVVDELHVLRIGVDSKLRRAGLARTLMSYVLSAAAEKGAQLGLLECRASNISAQRLYRGLGFHIEGSRKGYYRDNGEDALLLSLDMSDSNAKALAILRHSAV